MSSSSLSLTKAKEIAIKFIKKYKDSLCNGNTGILVSDEDIERYEAMTPSAFFSDNTVEANFGLHFSVFCIRELKHSKQAIIWMCVHNNYNDLVKKINRHTDKSLCDCWQMDGTWYNLTEARMEALETIFDQLGTKPKTQTAKKSSKKPAKKVAKKAEPKDDIIEVSDVVTIKNDVAFIDTENEKFDHLMHLGGENVDMWIDDTEELNASNQIDHVINAFKVAKKELDVFISELVKAKEAGAKNVVDADWCPIKDFEFNK
jgi:hypothetical protein